MSWIVTSSRLRWPEGTRLTEDELAGCNIDALAQGGHLAPAPDRKTTRQPNALPDDPADEPEEKQ